VTDDYARAAAMAAEQARREADRVEMGISGVRRPNIVGPRQTNNGNRVILDGNNIEDTKRIVLADLKDVDPAEMYRAGSWVLTISTQTTTITTEALVPPPINYAIVRVQFGSGGFTHSVYLNAAPNAVLQLPSATAIVDAFWDPDHAAAFHLPATVVVQAILQRGSSNTPARRSFYLDQTAGAMQITKAIPPFARRFQLFGTTTARVWLPGSFVTLFSNDTQVPVALYTGVECRNMAINGGQFIIPGGATHWRVNTPVGGSSDANGIDFEIAL
jgi:hypothetical protein